MNSTVISSSRLELNQGQAVLKLANAYPTLLDVMLEIIQNGLDADANKISLLIDLERSQVVCQDNGNGVTQKQFEEALASVGDSIKQKGKLGRFGLGLISPLGKCKQFTFTSRYRTGLKQFLEWEFDAKEIAKQSDQIDLPLRIREDLIGKAGLWWRTELRITGLTKDRVISKIDVPLLESAVHERFNATLRRTKSVIELVIASPSGNRESTTIRAQSYPGKKLDEHFVHNFEAGKVFFRLYLAQNAKKSKIKTIPITVGEIDNDFRFPFADFAKQFAESISSEALAALKSGIFSGEIVAEKVTLHQNRKTFERNEASVGFCNAIDEWYKQIGAKIIDEVRSERDNERYQDLGLKLMSCIKDLLDDPEFEALREVVKSFKFGSQGTGHYETQPDGKESTKAISIHGAGTTREMSGEHAGQENRPKREHPGHTPFTVAGPKGNNRRLVKDNSTGLSYDFQPMYGSSKLWELDMATGYLNFNVAHPHWVECKQKDRWVERLVKFITIQALTLFTMPDEWIDTQRRVLDDMVGPYIFLIKSS
ncbi:MAG: ATP-binding protein [Nitrospiria bacterium]